MVNIPNALTILRMMLVPVIVVTLLHGSYAVALGIFLGAGVSDILDGFIARRFGLCTRLGAFLDPLADKLLVVAVAITLARLGRLPWWLVLTVVGRDLIIVGGAFVYSLRTGNLEMDPTILSKFNTFVQISLMITVIANGAGIVSVAEWLPVFVWIAFLTALLSGGQYMVVWGIKGWLEVRKEKGSG